MNILMIAFEFPPLATSGVHRPMKLSRFLAASGINTTILTTDTDSYIRFLSGKIDPSLAREIPEDINVIRIPCDPKQRLPKGKLLTWFRLLFGKGDFLAKCWERNLSESLPNILRTARPDFVYVTIPPFEMAPLACKLIAGSGIPLIIDFRDPWSQTAIAPFASYLHYKSVLAAERLCLMAATKILCATPGVRRDLESAHPKVPRSKFFTLTNGYAQEIPKSDILTDVRHKPTITIGYVGAFYYNPKTRIDVLSPWWRRKPHRWLHYRPRKEDWLYQTPYFFFKALSKLLVLHPELKSRLQMKMACQKPQWLVDQIKEFNLTENVILLGHLDHDECLRFQNSCDFLLIGSQKVIGGLNYSISSKTFEYWMAKKPILAFVCGGDQQAALEASGCAIICNPDDCEASANSMHHFFTNAFVMRPDHATIAKYHSAQLAKSLAALLTEVANTHQSNP